MNEPKDPEAEETVQTTSDKAVDPAAICSALPVRIVADEAVTFEIGNQKFTLKYQNDDWDSLNWLADQLRRAFENAGATVIEARTTIPSNYREYRFGRGF